MSTDSTPTGTAFSAPSTGCSRRAFLQRATLASLGLAAGLSGLPAELLARAPSAITPSGVAGTRRSYPIPAADGVFVDEANELLLARVAGSVFALSSRCPHKSTATVAWQPGQDRFQCPKHKAIFSPAGVLRSGKPRRSLDRYGISRSGSQLSVDLATVYQEDTDAAAWQAAVVRA
jgi:nitrite reductase/ring-hydroxylating ferredoxin subunit